MNTTVHPQGTRFQTIDYGTRISNAELEKVYVSIDPSLVIQGYAKATLNEMRRMNPERFDSVSKDINVELLNDYFTFLLYLRIQSVKGELKEVRQIRQLWMPAWIQFAISCVGEVMVQDFGLHFIPHDIPGYEPILMDDAFKISNILRLFKADGLSVLDDCFPRSKEGSRDTMALAHIGNHIRGVWPVSHPIYSYVACFLGLKIQEDQQINSLYRCRYDDVNFITSMLLNDERVIR